MGRRGTGCTLYFVTSSSSFVLAPSMRKTHIASPNAPPSGRSWLRAADETFASTEQQPLERIEEYEGRMALLEERGSAKL
eukprot:SAG25_NODE_1001_length_4350_cov_1.862856_1_plen_80_part_10